ncbi:MAG TPA: sigma-70 family RNA polymerase sigma factor [Candidatus Polarisedimenticolia bacterium]|nr:sigma-70 family RNA polymerase sigma factor [Candidatus Polarisedimenticolia bacterium]
MSSVEPDGDTDDEMLARRAASGDESAFEILVGRFQAPIYRLAHRLTANSGDAEDVLQETSLQAYRGLPRFRGEARFSTWLYRIATNAALMSRRRHAQRPVEPLDEFLPRFDADGRHAAEPSMLALPSEVEENLDRRRLAESARAGIERLPELYRAAFVLRDLEEMPTREVAGVLGIEAAAVRQRVHRARLMLRGFLAHLAESGR